MIINKSGRKLLLTQENLEDDFTIIDCNSRETFFWLNGKASKKVMIKMLDSEGEDPIKEWNWSSPFVLGEMGSA